MLIYSNKEIAKKKTSIHHFCCKLTSTPPQNTSPFALREMRSLNPCSFVRKKKLNNSDFPKGRNLKFNQSLGYVLLKGKKA